MQDSSDTLCFAKPRRGLCAVLPAAFAIMCVASCARDGPKCAAGQLKYDGRPPSRLFAYNTACDTQCFSLPSDECSPSCGRVKSQVSGWLVDDRQFILLDTASVWDACESAHGEGCGLAFTFGYVDQSGGNAPATWGFTTAGASTYLANTSVGPADFLMSSSVVRVVADAATMQSLMATGGDVVTGSDVAFAQPGRLEIQMVSHEVIAGHFYLTHETLTGQKQGRVEGCFSAELGPAIDVGGISMRALR